MKDSRKKLRSDLLNGFKLFYNKLFGEDFDFGKCEAYKNFEQMVEVYVKQDFDDFDVEVNVKYQVEPIGAKNTQVKYKKPKSICNIADSVIKLPNDTTTFTVYAKPVFRGEDHGLVAKKTIQKPLFEQKVIVVRDKNFDAYPKDGTKYNVPDDVMVVSYEEIDEHFDLIEFVKPDEVKL